MGVLIGLGIGMHRPEAADLASVEFIARYKACGRAGRLHEISRFRREDGRWLYVDGEFIGQARIARVECRSG
jgi:SEC-C motif-containing protein